MLITILLSALALQPARPFADERALLDRRLEALRRILPDGPTVPADTAHVRDLAEAARLAKVHLQARAPVETGSRGEAVLELTALGGFEEIDRLFQKLALSHRLVDVESLALTATTSDVIQLSAVLRLPYWPKRAPLPTPPESPRSRPPGVPRPTLEQFLQDQALAFAKSDAIAVRRRSRRTPRLFLSELAAVVRERPVVLNYAALGEEFTIRGIVVGEGPLRAFESRLERGFLRVSELLIQKQGACHRFEAHGSCPVAGPDAAIAVPIDDPFDSEAAGCRIERDPPRAILIKGKAPSPRSSRNGPLTLRLRDLDLTDVFQTLSLLGAGGYLVDDAVKGRLTLELTGTTVDDAIAAIRKAASLSLGGAAPLRHVTQAQPSPSGVAHPPGGGPLASFALKRVEIRDLLAAMADVDANLAALGPPGFLGRVSVWTKDVPLHSLRALVLDAAGLRERTEEGRRILERATGSAEPATPIAPSTDAPRLAARREDLTLNEFEIAGIASLGEKRLALAYSPTGQLYSFAPGDRLFDAVVRAVEPGEVLLDTEEGPLHLTLPPVER